MTSRREADPASDRGADVFWLVAVAVLAGLLYPISKRLAGFQDGDGILTSLISTQKLTWYFWGQDRLLNFFPALAWPIEDLELNLHFQTFLRCFTTFLAPTALLVLLLKDKKSLLVLTAVAGLILAIAARGSTPFNLYIQHSPFGPSLVLFAVSASVLSRFRPRTGWPLALLLGILSYAVNLALIILTVPLLLLCLLLRVKGLRYLLTLLGIQVLAVVAAYLHAKTFGEAVTSFGLNPSIAAIKAGWSILAENLSLAWLASLLVLAACAAAMLRTRQAGLALLVATGMPVAISAMSCLTWLQMNGFNVRYYLTFVLVFSTCCAYLLVTPVVERLTISARRIISIFSVLITFSFCLGGLSDTPRELIAPQWRAQSRAAADIAIKEKVQIIVGDFWDVWPAIFSARQSLREQGRAGTPMYGGAFRGHVLSPQIVSLMHQQGRLRSLCLMESLSECLKNTVLFATHEPVRYVAGSLKRVDVAGKVGLVYEVRPDALSPAYRDFCLVVDPVRQDLPHQVGTWEDGHLVSDGRPGFLMFGPYRAVPAGRYALQLAGRTGKVSGAWVDVDSGAGTVEHARVGLTSSSRGEIAELSFLLPEAVSDLEIRVWSDTGSDIEVSGYRVRPAGLDTSQCKMEASAAIR